MSDGVLKELTFAAGFEKNNTELANEGKWVQGDKIRFRYGKPEPIGGWVSQPITQDSDSTSVTFTGIAREAITWQTNDARDSYFAVGTHQLLEFSKDNVIYDMTPIKAITTVSSAVYTSIGSTEVLVCVDSHDMAANDFMVFGSAASTVGGLTLSGRYQITSIANSDSYYVDVGTTAVATSTLAADITITHLINSGLQSNGVAYGWGAGPWSHSDGWGGSYTGTDAVGVMMRKWSIANWGEDVLAAPRRGSIYYWDADTSVDSTLENRSDVRLTIVTAAPTVNNHILVTRDRRVVSFGTTDLNGNFDPLLVRWTHQEDYEIWDPTTSVFGGNTAGEDRVRGGSEIVTAVQSKREIIILTDNPVYAMRNVGTPFHFSFEEIGSNAGVISPTAAIDVEGIIFWWGNNAFYKYDGTLKVIPCTLQKALFRPTNVDSVNLSQKQKIYVGLDSEFNEIIWHYPSRDSDEVDRYVIYNYLENTWYDGTMGRTVWHQSDVFNAQYAFGTNSYLYLHEEGKNDDTVPMNPWIESSYFDLEDGENFMFIDKFVPDFKSIPTGKEIEFTITYKKYPQDTESFTKGPFPITNATRKINFRARGRQAKIRYESNTLDNFFQTGVPRINIYPDGER